jgi:hypothetical protein
VTRTKRRILALGLLELFLAGLWYYLALMATTSSEYTPERGREIGQTMGTVMGVILGLSPVLILFAWSNDRKAAAKKEE